MEIGIDSFAEILPDPATGKPPSATDRMADLLDEVEVADCVGLDVFGMGEQHRAEFLDSAPASRGCGCPHQDDWRRGRGTRLRRSVDVLILEGRI